MNQRILVTGVNGFVGHHVAKQLHEIGAEVIGAGNQDTVDPHVSDFVTEYIGCDLTDPVAVSQIDLRNINGIINLAGFASVSGSKGQADLYNKVNVGVHSVLYEECIRQNVSPSIVAVSTGAVYDPNQPLPHTEISKLAENLNEYVSSKLLMEEAVRGFISRGLRCMIARPFNHTGPGQLPGFLLPDLYEQILTAQRENTPLMTGNLNTRRDFTDVRDVAKAYIELVMADSDKVHFDTYNICTGKSVTGTQILELLCNAMGISRIETKIDQSRLRENEVMDIYGSADRLKQATGWSPTIAIEQTIQDFVAWKQAS